MIITRDKCDSMLYDVCFAGNIKLIHNIINNNTHNHECNYNVGMFLFSLLPRPNCP